MTQEKQQIETEPERKETPLAKLPFEINNLTFTYPDRQKPCLSGIDLQVQQGEFIDLGEAHGVNY